MLLLYSHLHVHSASQRHNTKDRCVKDNAWRKTQEDFFTIIFTSHFIARFEKGYSKFACERILETEHKLYILTPLLWPSRCVFIVLLMLGSIPSGLSEGPLGLVWPSLPHLVSNPLGFCWQLHRGFSECPLGRVWPSLPHLVSTVWNSTGNCSGTQTQLS